MYHIWPDPPIPIPSHSISSPTYSIMDDQLILVFIFTFLFHWPGTRPWPCNTCPRKIVDSSASSASCGGSSEECAPITTTKAPTTTTKPVVDGSTSSSGESSESEEPKTVQTMVLAIAIRNLKGGDACCAGERKKCTEADCNNHGACFGSVAKPVCLCRKGYCGPLCKWAYCPGNHRCNDHGWCLATSDEARCVCRPEYEGKYCERKKKEER